MKTEATWIEIDPTSLPAQVREGYERYKALYREMKDARNLFEMALSAQAAPPQGKRVVFGYNFGKLSVAIVDDDRKPTKPKTSITSLAQFMAQAQANGHAT